MYVYTNRDGYIFNIYGLDSEDFKQRRHGDVSFAVLLGLSYSRVKG
ncbi:hypothetical protein [Anaerosolibacter carboniphilus]|nr:hypothetical protein [Anaerosolibacter carboniphilus]